MPTKTLSVPAFVLDPNHTLTPDETETGGDNFVSIETVKNDPARVRQALAKELEMIAKPIERVRAVASYLGLTEEFPKEIRRLIR